MDLVADRLARKVLAGRVRLPRKAGQVAKGSRADMADLVSREDLADQAARKVLAGQAKLPWNADQKSRVGMAKWVVQANRMDTVDRVVQVARKVLAGPAKSPSKQVPPTEDLRRRSQTSRSISRSSGHERRGADAAVWGRARDQGQMRRSLTTAS
jgi:hypothetical protein